MGGTQTTLKGYKNGIIPVKTWKNAIFWRMPYITADLILPPLLASLNNNYSGALYQQKHQNDHLKTKNMKKKDPNEKIIYDGHIGARCSDMLIIIFFFMWAFFFMFLDVKWSFL